MRKFKWNNKYTDSHCLGENCSKIRTGSKNDYRGDSTVVSNFLFKNPN